MTQASNLFLTFCLYSFLGWVCESIYCSIGERKLINRGFLNGPVCPVYGFGAVIVVKLLTPFENNLVLLFLTGMAATSVLEYITGFLLETLFHTKWWDYSGRKCNIHGRVCLRNSLLFGGLSVIAMKLVNPVVAGLVDCPVIAVPTSVGYGANFHGVSALLTMLNSCANGISVVNIDNGYGAGYLATQINRLAVK